MTYLKTLSILFLLAFGFQLKGQEIPNIKEFQSLLGQDVKAISDFLTNHQFILGDTTAQGKANRTCCPDINYKAKRFYALYYSDGHTDIQLIVRNDQKLFSIQFIFPAKNKAYMQSSEAELKSQSFQVVESKRFPKDKRSYKELRCNASLTKRAFFYYDSPDKADTMTIDDWKLINEK
jgi:hypothetical protein